MAGGKDRDAAEEDLAVPSRKRRAPEQQEQHRINEFLQQQPGAGGPLAADGGLFADGLSRQLDRDQMLALFHTFFSPYASRTPYSERAKP